LPAWAGAEWAGTGLGAGAGGTGLGVCAAIGNVSGSDSSKTARDNGRRFFKGSGIDPTIQG
jgi:hypothetical protein